MDVKMYACVLSCIVVCWPGRSYVNGSGPKEGFYFLTLRVNRVNNVGPNKVDVANDGW